MRTFRRGERVPAEVLDLLDLPRGEKVLAHARAADGTWLLGGRRSLFIQPVGEPCVQIPWEQVEDATWDQESDRLQVTGIGTYGEPRPAYAFELDDPILLLQLVRERVTASIVLQRRVPVRGKQAVTVIGRRSPVGGPVAWMHAYDPGLDPEDPEVAEVAAAALSGARAEVGEDSTSPI